MSYLIPKSARNVKIQLFKGLGVIEVVFVIIAILIVFFQFQIQSLDIAIRIGIAAFVSIFTVFLVSPSFIVNKKGYQSFEVFITYFSQQKDFKKKKSVIKNGK